MRAFIIPKEKKECSIDCITKIIPGGQTGVDYGALLGAESLGLVTGGWIPQKCMTSNGPNDKLKNLFGCIEIPYKDQTLSQQYVERSKRNVNDSDGSIGVRLYSSVGTDYILGYCIHGYWTKYKGHSHVKTPHRPYLIITDFNDIQNRQRIREFINEHQIKTLNVFGHREPLYCVPTIDLLANALKPVLL